MINRITVLQADKRLSACKLKYQRLMMRIAVKISIIVVIAVCVSCNKKTPVETVRFRPDMRINNFVSYNYHEGKLSWRLEAEKSSYYIDENRSIAERVVLNYFKEEKLAAVVKADRAIINTNSKDIELIGNVDAVSPAGNRLLTSRIQWYSQNGYLETDEHVKIIRKNGDVIEGIGLRANYNLEDYEIKRSVKAVTSDTDSIIKKK